VNSPADPKMWKPVTSASSRGAMAFKTTSPFHARRRSPESVWNEWKSAYNGSMRKVSASYKLGLCIVLFLLGGCGVAPAPRMAPLPEGCTSPGTILSADLPQPRRGYPYSYRVYLPPCYAAGTEPRYPVLYLVPGRSSGPETWFAAELTDVVDRMILNKEIPPFIIVTTENIDNDPMTDTIYNELIPHVESQYPILDDRRYRAVAGGSLGNIPIHCPVQAYSAPGQSQAKTRASVDGCQR
jgi:hypothetical protein